MFSGLQHFIQDKCFLAFGNLTSCYGSTLLRHLETLNTDFFFHPADTLIHNTWASFQVSRLLWAAWRLSPFPVCWGAGGCVYTVKGSRWEAVPSPSQRCLEKEWRNGPDSARKGLCGGSSSLLSGVNVKPDGHLPAMWSCALAASHTAGQASLWLHWGALGACPEAGRYWSPAESLHLKAVMWRRRALREAGWALA